MENNRRFPLILSNFWIKIIAFITMTFDHIGFLMPDSYLAYAFRIIGRISLPLFIFLVFEGAMHTKNFNKYALRLGIMASVISIAIIGVAYLPAFKENSDRIKEEGNIFIDLLLCAVTVYLLKQEKWYFKLLSILPLAFGIASYIATAMDSCGCYGEILWLPFFLRSQYGFYPIIMCMFFYLAVVLTKAFCRYHSSISGIDVENYKGSNFERIVTNIFSIVAIVISTLVFYLVTINLPPQFFFLNIEVQLFALISGAFILLYSGLRGYNKKWFQYGSYLYYPVHLIILYLIFAFI